MSPEQSVKALTKMKADAEALLAAGGPTESEHSAWHATTRGWLQRAFGSDSHKISSVLNAGQGFSVQMYAGEAVALQRRRDQVRAAADMLSGLIKDLEFEQTLTTTVVSQVPAATDLPPRVFLVHGRDDGARETVARFLENLDLDAVILSEQANEGRTLIEKFEQHADVSFAVVLLTPDDRGGIDEEPFRPAKRARQNVMFELGYFVGKLSRKRVCALYVEGVELPSDFHGVVYVPLDEHGAWKFRLAKELRTVLPSVDMNKAI